MASQGITTLVVIRGTDHTYLCVRHGLWLRATTQLDLAHVPEIIHAQQRHARLARRRDRSLVASAHTVARRIALAWYDGRWHRELTDRWDARLQALGVDPWTPTRLPWADQLDAAIYPEMVALTGLLALPSWHEHIAATPFLQEAGRRFGIAEPHMDMGVSDPLVRWARHHRNGWPGNGQLQ